MHQRRKSFARAFGNASTLKCQYAQGYLFSEPLPAEEADLFILNRAEVSSRSAIQISTLEHIAFTM